MFGDLKILESISGKFGVIIKGELDGVYFKATCNDLDDGKISIHAIESDYNQSAIRKALIWYGHADF